MIICYYLKLMITPWTRFYLHFTEKRTDAQQLSNLIRGPQFTQSWTIKFKRASPIRPSCSHPYLCSKIRPQSLPAWTLSVTSFHVSLFPTVSTIIHAVYFSHFFKVHTKWPYFPLALKPEWLSIACKINSRVLRRGILTIFHRIMFKLYSENTRQ